MRKIYSFLVAAVAIVTVASCAQEIDNPGQNGEKAIFTAYTDGADTKTVLGINEETQKPLSKWNGEEWIQIVGKGNYWMNTKVETPSSSAMVYYNGTNGEFKETEGVFAVYPAGNEKYGKDGDRVTGVSVPTTQTAVAGSYDPNAAAAIAYTENNELKFKNVPALLKFTMGSENVGKVTFWGTTEDDANAVVSGTGSVAYNEGNPVFTPASTKDAAKTYVELLNNGSKFENGGIYYIAIIPGKFKSITVEFDGISAKSKTFDTPYEISRNEILDLGTIESQGTGRVIVGSTSELGSWNASNGIQFIEGANYYEAKNVTLTGSEEFKLVIDGGWFSSSTAKTGAWLSLVDGANMKLSSGTYDFYLTKEGESKLYIAVSGSTEPLAPGIIAAKEGWVYLKPNSNWTQAGARFAIYLCNGSKAAKWLSMSSVDGTSYYGVQLPNDYTVANYKNIIFVRMNPANNTNDWNNKWNQTGDLASSKILTDKNNCCTINNGQWDAGTNVTWSKITQLN